MTKMSLFATEAYNEFATSVAVIDEKQPKSIEVTAMNPDYIAEVENIISDVAVMTDATEVAIESIDTLNRLQATLFPHQETGVSQSSVKLLKIATEDIYRQLDYRQKNEMPSLEAFASIHTAGPSTRIAMEGLIEFFQDLWTKIVAVFKKIWEAVTSIFSSGLAKAEEVRIESYSRALEAEMKELRGMDKKDLPKGGVITDFKYYQMFTLPDEVASIQSAERVLRNGVELLSRMKTMERAFDIYTGLVELSLDEFELSIRSQANLKKIDEKKDKILSAITREMNPFYEHAFQKVKTAHLTTRDHEAIQAHPKSKNTLSSDYLIAGNHFLFFQDPMPFVDAHAYKDEVIYVTATPPGGNFEMAYPDVNKTEQLATLFIELGHALEDHCQLGHKFSKRTESIMNRMRDIEHLIPTLVSQPDEVRTALISRTHEEASILLALMNGPVIFNAKVYTEVKKTQAYSEDLMRKITNYYGLGKKSKETTTK